MITGDGQGERELDRSPIGSLSMEHIRPCMPSLKRFGMAGLWFGGAAAVVTRPVESIDTATDQCKGHRKLEKGSGPSRRATMKPGQDRRRERKKVK